MNIDDLKELLNQAQKAGAKVEVIDHTPDGAPGLAGLSKLINRPSITSKRPASDVQLMELKQYLEDYKACRFKVGDVVTPKKSSILRGAGHPFIVMETREVPEPMFDCGSETSGHDFGSRFNIRVCGFSDDGQHILCWWNESMYYETWTPETAPSA